MTLNWNCAHIDSTLNIETLPSHNNLIWLTHNATGKIITVLLNSIVECIRTNRDIGLFRTTNTLLWSKSVWLFIRPPVSRWTVKRVYCILENILLKRLFTLVLVLKLFSPIGLIKKISFVSSLRLCYQLLWCEALPDQATTLMLFVFSHVPY